MSATLLALALLAAGVAGDDASSASCRDDAGADAFKADSLVQLVAQYNRTRSGICREALKEDVKKVCGEDGWYICPGAADRLFFSKNSFHTNPCARIVGGKKIETPPKGTDFKDQQQFMMQVAKSLCNKGISLYVDFADERAYDIIQAYNTANSLTEDGKDEHGNKMSWDDATTKHVNGLLTEALERASLFVWILGSEGPYTDTEVKERPKGRNGVVEPQSDEIEPQSDEIDPSLMRPTKVRKGGVEALSTAIDPSLISALVSKSDYDGLATKLKCATTPECNP